MARASFFLIGVLALVLYLWFSPQYLPSTVAFVGGEIVTMSADSLGAEALLVRDGRIAAVGTEGEISALAGENVHTIDLAGGTLMPGLIEAHTHPIAAALLSAAVDVSGFTHDSRADVMATLHDAAEGFSLGEWLVAFGWDPVMVADLEPPTLAELDRIAPDRPLIILTQMLHDVYANSAALKAAGIDRDTPDPAGGQFVRDASGDLTGTVREVNAIDILVAALPRPPQQAVNLMLSLQYGRYARAGYTTLGVLGPVGRTDDPIGTLRDLAEDPRVPVRTVVYPLPAQIEDGDLRPGEGGERFRIQGVKFWMDGSPFAGGAAWAKPYADTALTRDRLHLDAGHMGALNYEANGFAALFEKYHRLGFQIAVHVQGERAIDRVLDAAEAAQDRHPRKDARHRLEHNALITEDQLVRAHALNMTTSFFVDHIYFYGDRLPELVGHTRTERYMPLATAERTGHRISIHTDNPATPLAPFRALRTAVLRQPRRGGLTIAPAERLDVESALRTVTIDAAWQLGIEEEAGSLAPGKRADLVVLSHNPLTTPPEQWTEIEVLATWIDGRPVDARALSWRNVKLGAALLWELAFSRS